MSTSFRNILSSAAPAPGGRRYTVGEDWLQGRSQFGGLQAAMMVDAMQALLSQPAPLRTLQVTFLAPVPAGETAVRAQVLRAGKSTTHCEARIQVGEAIAALAIGVFGLARESKINLNDSVWPVDVPASDPRKQIPYVPGVTPVFVQHYRQRWARGGYPFTAAKEPRTQIWLQQTAAPVQGLLEVVALADAMPSPALSMLRQPAMASSMTWMLDLLQTDFSNPGDGDWLMDTQVTHGAEGYVQQTALLWDPQRRPAALARQAVTVFA